MTEKDTKKPQEPPTEEPKVLSDSEVKELYSKLHGEEKPLGLFSKLKKSADSIVKKTTDAIDDIEEDTKPLLGKFANQTKGELGDFSKESTTKMKNVGSSLKNASGKYFGKTLDEIEDGTKFLKERSPEAADKFKDGLEKTGDSIKKNIPKAGKQTKNSFMDSIEKIQGSRTIGKEYGQKSVQILRELGELKESGLISEKDYAAKKREILERI